MIKRINFQHLILVGAMLTVTWFSNMSILKAQVMMPKVISGKLIRLEKFHSKFVTERNIDVWLPEGYSTHSKYSVLYMHDGQMLFDPEITWNKQSWNIDDIVSDLMTKKKIKPLIVVGIWNDNQTRHTDYFPQKPYEALNDTDKDTVTAQLIRAGRVKTVFHPLSDHYLKFIVSELKPYIDSNFSVNKDRAHTFIAGSSMGGLISLYAISEYPQVFGGAACISTHWPGTFTLEHNPVPNAMIQYLNDHLPTPQYHTIYFDCGDQTLDALYPDIQKRVDSLMSSKGYDKKQWLTKYYPGEDHSEKAWMKRFHIPLEFLLNSNRH